MLKGLHRLISPPLLQVLAICLYVLPGPPGIVRAVVMGLAVVATVVTGADYAIRAVRLHRSLSGILTGEVVSARRLAERYRSAFPSR